MSDDSVVQLEPTAQAEATGQIGESTPDTALIEDLLVEEVSIDGMCGVY